MAPAAMSPSALMFARARTLVWMLAVVVAAPGCRQQAEERAREGDASAPAGRAVALVNGTPILREDFERTLQHAEKVFSKQRGALAPQERAALSERILDKMIEAELLVQHARAQGVRVTDEEIHSERQSAGGSEAAFFQYLEENDLDPQRVRASLERILLIRRLSERLRAELKVSDQEVARYHQRHPDEFRTPGTVELAHLLFRQQEGQEDPLARARKVRGEILAGLSFEEAAARYSDDATTRELGGRLGMLKQGELLHDLDRAAFSVKVGSVSVPVQSPRGFHLLKVLARTPGKPRPLAQVRDEVRERLLDLRSEEALRELTAHLLQQATVSRGGT